MVADEMADYIALIHKDADSDYGVSFPDFPGCVSAGSTLEEARRMGAEALALHLEGLIQDGEAIPEPSNLDQVMHDPDNRDGVAILVHAEVKAKAVRVNIILSEEALREIDRYAENHGFTRSGFLVTAARRLMATDRQGASET
jgi:predicted RNase H-like HicB family nuclease